jgi:hypothetical protein
MKRACIVLPFLAWGRRCLGRLRGEGARPAAPPSRLAPVPASRPAAAGREVELA